ncbi:MAG: methylmalonyl Co-A mutase-associated GTPase MeaB, partial [Myxococcota bacterium]|nr:methylmalonyl Co-A mutase-associated GTPase MeaB [Myxococcota bacterium]
MISLGGGRGSMRGGLEASEVWTPAIVKCVATRGEGTTELLAALDRHRAWVQGTAAGRQRRRERLAQEVKEALREALIEAAVHDLRHALDAALAEVDARTVDPYTATERLVESFRSRR